MTQLVHIFVKFYQFSPNIVFLFNQVLIFISFVQIWSFLLIPFKELTVMNNDSHVSICVFFLFLFIVHVSVQ